MPGNPPAEADLHDPKPAAMNASPQTAGVKSARAAQQHQTQTHHRHNAKRKTPTRNNGCPIQQEPNTRQGGKNTGVIEDPRSKGANDNRWCQN